MSLSYGRGTIFTIQDSNKRGKQRTALYYQFPDDASTMSGAFKLKFFHGVPSVNSWPALFPTPSIVRTLSADELEEAITVINNAEMNERYNVTIRWRESHYRGCSYMCSTAPHISVPQHLARMMHLDMDDSWEAVNHRVGQLHHNHHDHHYRPPDSRTQTCPLSRTNRAAALRHVQSRMRKPYTPM